MAKLFNAKMAKEAIKKFYGNGLNYQRKEVLKLIQGAALNGYTNIVLDNPIIKLFDEDYDFFKKLGYNVYPEEIIKYCNLSDKHEYYKHKFGIISWED